MYTRKQRWRRTRTRKHAWDDLPPEVLDAMLAAGVGMPKSVSWDHSYAAALKIRADKAAEVARRAAREDSRLKAAAAAAKGTGVEPVQIPRSLSCSSSLGPKRSLFTRSASKEELGRTAEPMIRGSSAVAASQKRRLMLPHRKGVSFDTQVKMVLIPKREEFSESERMKLWWAREDYAQFRQVLIDWKRANAHRISNSDNILSINLSGMDEEEEESNSGQSQAVSAAVAPGSRYNYAHDEAAAAADATAEAAAAAAQAAAEAAQKSAAAAQATAAAATATAIEVAALHAEEVEPAVRQHEEVVKEVAAAAAAAVALVRKNESCQDGDFDAWGAEVAAARAIAAEGAAAGGGGVSERAASSNRDSVLSDIPEGQEAQEEGRSRTGDAKRAPLPRARSVIGMPSPAAWARGPDWSPGGGANGTFPLRRAFTFGDGHSPSPPEDAGGRLKAVPLSEAQAMAESLRAWRKSFDDRVYFAGGGGGGDDDGSDVGEEDRGRAVSFQQQTRKFARRGRATALVSARTTWASDVSGVAAYGIGHHAVRKSRGGKGGSGATAGGGPSAGDGSSSSRSGGGCVDRGRRQEQQQQQQQQHDEGEKQHRTLSDQEEWSSSRRTVEIATGKAASPAKPVVAAFGRERRAAAARQAELEEARATRAAVMVRPAAAAKAEDGEASEEATGEDLVGAVVQLGLNDAPGSAAAASAAGLRIAADGVSNLSQRARDSVENLQEIGEQSWGPLPLSSSA